MKLREVLFGGSGGTSPQADVGLMLLRGFTGLALALAHGLGKLPPNPRFVERVGGFGFPAPELFAWASGRYGLDALFRRRGADRSEP
ncbi:hypothetical protein BH23GEM5_BH23GEM5_03830 [soil metagenome]